MTDTATLEHVYGPRGGCRRLFETRSPEVVLSGPYGTGKSRACLEKLHQLALLHPGMRACIVRKTAASLDESALVTWREHVIPEAMAAGDVRRHGRTLEHGPGYSYRNGSFISYGGMDKANRVLSTEYDIIYVQEAIELTEDDWEALVGRLRYGRVPFQQLIADTNPDAPTHWLKQRCDGGQTVLIETRHEDNPRLVNEDGTYTVLGADYMTMLDGLSGVRYKRGRLGLWVAAEGQIYDAWDPAVHMVDPFPVPASWRRWWVVDFGFRNPFVLQWWAEDPDGRLYLYREIYMTGRLVEDHARQALDIVAPEGEWLEPQPHAIICDTDAEDAATLERHLGMGTTAATKDVKPGIERVQARLRPDATGRPGLYIMRGTLVERDPHLQERKKPQCTADEVGGYVWAPDPTLPGKPRKEEPLKVDDHGMDCVRYLVSELDEGLAPQVRMMDEVPHRAPQPPPPEAGQHPGGLVGARGT